MSVAPPPSRSTGFLSDSCSWFALLGAQWISTKSAVYSTSDLLIELSVLISYAVLVHILGLSI